MKRRLTERFFRRLSFTREGKIFTLVSIGAGVGAINTGNNLLYLVLGLMLGLILISGVLSEWNLSRLRISRSLPPRAVENEIFPAGLMLINDRSRAPAFAVELCDEINGALFKRRCFYLKVDPRDRRAISYRCEIFRRGPAQFSGAMASTRFPFGLFEKKVFLAAPERLLVWPARTGAPFLEAGGTLDEGRESPHRSFDGLEFFQLRPFQDGDDPRRIHWRSTARQGYPVVRDGTDETSAPLEIVVDAAARAEFPDVDPEQVIRVAGTLVQDITASGSPVRLITAGPSGARVIESRDPVPLMDHLALLLPEQLSQWESPKATGPGAILVGPLAKSGFPAVSVSFRSSPEGRG